MTLLILAYLAGILTILSPCILPVLPFVFSRANQPFLRSGLPMLVGMAATFAVVATLAAVAGGWAVAANQYGRIAAIMLLALFGITLLFPELSDRATRPLVGLGARLSQSLEANGGDGGQHIVSSLVLGVATGLLWAPCAGPVLGLILTGAALKGANLQTSLLLLAYALGAATSLAFALLVGGRVFTAMKRSLGVGEWIRRGLGAAVLAGVAAIALGLDTGFLTNLSFASTNAIEQRLVDGLRPDTTVTGNQQPPLGMQGSPAMMAGNPAMMMKGAPATQGKNLGVEGNLPSLSGAVDWLNSGPLTPDRLKGKVVLIDFWTYSCINCLRTIPYIRAWAEKYKDQGLVVIGVHTPEFAFEKNLANVKKAVADFKIEYPVAVDNDYAIWRGFDNQYWPAHYFIDAQGHIRYHHFGEGDYEGSEGVIQQLLAEAGHADVVKAGLVSVKGAGAEVEADAKDERSPETYIGYDRIDSFISADGLFQDVAHDYSAPALTLNQWSLSGDWTIGNEHALLNKPHGSILYRFHARDLHLVLGPGPDGKPVHFRVTIDGNAPGNDHGVDTDGDGQGVVTGERLYQLVRQTGAVGERTFEIHFLDSGVQAYAFTFG